MNNLSPSTAPAGSSPRVGIDRFGWSGLLIGLLVAISTFVRAVIVAAGHGWHGGRIASLLAAFVAGGVFDVLVALWLAMPLTLYLVLLPRARYQRRTHRTLRRLTLATALFGGLFVAISEVVFFAEFDGRFNFVAVDYLIYPTEVVTNIWQSYPVAWLIAGIAAAVVGLLWAFRRTFGRLDERDGPARRGRLVGGAAYAMVLFVLTRAVSPNLARVSPDRDLNELAANGYYTFWQALLGRDAPYDGLYATEPDSAVFARLHQLVARDGTDPTAPRLSPASPTDRVIQTSSRPRPLNVVIVLEESLGSEFVGALHPEARGLLTPRFDSLAGEGTLLTHAYSTGNRTIRALEATTASLPPLPGVSVVRRPQSVDLFTLPNVLRSRGYATEFIYGGRALFDGMGEYMRRNGVDRVVEQGDFPRGIFATAWGVADEAIFDRALIELDSLHSNGKPFYAMILTVSNHKPYDYPTGRIAEDPAAHSRGHAVRYADWALGRFVREARTHAFFDSTLFVFMGDHGARVYGAAEIPLPSYEVPIVFYGPRIVAAGKRVATLASSLDVPPTVLGILGGEYSSRFFGRDVFRDRAEDGRALMTHNAELALMRGARMAVLGLRGATTVYAVNESGDLRAVAHPTTGDRELASEAVAFYEGADHLYRSGTYRFAVPQGAQRVDSSSYGSLSGSGP
ncbi:MAG TPA: LTA synthase family protein [Gemmatimonadaceae bacterium]|nr:LTA synthase family protein [Gemmatimonadaceae bacterium]